MQDCNGAPETIWLVTGEKITDIDGRCLRPQSPSGVNGTTVVAGVCTRQDATGWQVVGTQIRGADGRCLTAPRPGVAGESVRLTDCAGTPTQRWSLRPG